MALFGRHNQNNKQPDKEGATEDLFDQPRDDQSIEPEKQEVTQEIAIEEISAEEISTSETLASHEVSEEKENSSSNDLRKGDPSLGDSAPPRQPPTALTGGFGFDGDGNEIVSIADFSEKSYLEYAMSVVVGRAIPYVHDGMKPVQRRILFTMKNLGLTHNAKKMKSARVVGDVLGKYHPHGDTSVYDAAVRIAQDFSLRYPLIDGQGNFGSREGDSAAAMRYTEMRLTPISELLLSEIDQDTVDFTANYDGSMDEPTLLPARLPFILMNGASGVAVGMASEIPSHNIREVADAAILAIKEYDRLDSKSNSGSHSSEESDSMFSLSGRDREHFFNKVMDVIQGPDFPDGGQITSLQEEIIESYRTGSGTLRMRAIWDVEQLARGQYQIVIKELPYGVDVNAILVQIEALSNPKPGKNQKSINQSQINKKQAISQLISLARNESEKTTRLVIEPKTSKVAVDDIMNFLLANTHLDHFVKFNTSMVGLNGKPTRKGIVDILMEWAAFRFGVVTRRTRFNYNKLMDRIHILEGRMIAFLHIEEVIRVIRESDDAKSDLMIQFKLSEIQAEDVLEIKLRQLARLEGIRIENEINKFSKEAEDLKSLLDNRSLMRSKIISEIREDVKKYGDDRRTIIKPVERVKVSIATQIVDEPVTIILSKQGWVRARQGHEVDMDALTHKPGDTTFLICKTRTTRTIVLMDSNGRTYSIQAANIPGGRGEGVPLSTMIELQGNAKVIALLSDDPETRYLLSGSMGYGFIAPLSGMIAKPKAGKVFMKPAENERILPPIKIESGINNKFVAAKSSQGKLLIFQLSEINTYAAGGKGVMLMDIPDNEKLESVELFGQEIQMTRKNKKGGPFLSQDELQKFIGRRAKKGYMYE